MTSDISIRRNLTDKVLLITGVTGFLGKAILKQLICERVAFQKIYLLIRPGNDGFKRRFEQLKKHEYFEKHPIPSNVYPLEGDITLPNLGIDDPDAIRDLNIIIASAADVTFHRPFHEAVKNNVLATMYTIQFAESCPQLEAYIHVSTCYVNSFHPSGTKVLEELVPLPFELLDFLKDVSLAVRTNRWKQIEQYGKLFKDYPNTYTMSKTIAEHIVMMSRVKSCIVRPSIVNPAAEGKTTCIIDTEAGSIPFIMGITKGILPGAHINQHINIDLIPVEYVVNTILLVLSYNLQSSELEERIFTSSSYRNPINIREYFDGIVKCVKVDPFGADLNFQYILVEEDIELFLLMRLPPKGMKNEHYRKYLQKMYTNYEHFIRNEWSFDDTNTQTLIKRLSSKETHAFTCDIRTVDWKDYIKLLGNTILSKRQLRSKL